MYVRFSDLAGNTADTSAVITFVAGDVDGNVVLEPGDAVTALQILTGTATDKPNPDADVNGDGRIGTEEAVYILRRISDRTY